MAANNIIAFATCRTFPALAEDDCRLSSALSATGYTVEATPWDEDDVDWTRYQAVVIRSTWNYHLHPVAFRTWLHRLQKQDVRVFNPVNILEWNMDKSYLEYLQQQGVPLPPTQFLEMGSHPDLSSIFQSTGWQRAVIKPCISATAHNTWVTRSDTAIDDNPRLHELLKSGRYMIQEFMEGVEKDGEYSLLFFGQQYSHAVKKTARAGDFRVQEKYGGTSLPTRPEPDIIRQATTILNKVVALFDGAPAGEPGLLYARVDGVICKGVFTLMELELIEPTLFFGHHPQAIQQFIAHFSAVVVMAKLC